MAHSTASVTFDLPDPFGPTTTLTPGPKSSRVRSGKDLKPFSVSDFRYTRPLSLHLLDRFARRLLLGMLLAAAAARAEHPALHARRDRVTASMRRALLARHRVADLLAAPGQELLQRRLENDRGHERMLDLRAEGLDHGGGGAPLAPLQGTGPDPSLHPRGAHAPRA